MIRILVFGYGNLGRAVCSRLSSVNDMALQGVCTRRAEQLNATGLSVPFFSAAQLDTLRPDIDVVINCGGSARDLPRSTARLAGHFCVVDSFDTHAAIPEHFAAVDTAARSGGTLCVVSAGWDPGLFSLMRSYGAAFLPEAQISTFWGPGISQGHSDALRQLPGVLDARQYTIPSPDALAAARNGGKVPCTRHCHRRVCYVVPKADADLLLLEHTIRTMPGYFAGYEVEIHFVTAEELKAHHDRLPHGGHVICTTPKNSAPQQLTELRLQLSSNPDFTAGILIACARAAFHLHRKGERGCRTMLDIPPALYHARDAASLRAGLL